MVPKEGKGKYDVTVPEPYEFQKAGPKPKTIRERKVEQMLIDKRQKEDLYINHQFKANRIPRTTTDNLYEKICQDNETRR